MTGLYPLPPHGPGLWPAHQNRQIVQAHCELAGQAILGPGDQAAAPGWCRRRRAGVWASECWTAASGAATIWRAGEQFAVYTRPKQDPDQPCALLPTLAEAIAWAEENGR